MKKALAVILVLVMAFSIISCAGSGGTTTPTPPAPTAAPPASDNTPAPGGKTPAPGTPSGDGPVIGWFDRNYDYTQNRRFTVTYLISSGSALYDALGNALGAWAEVFNCDFNKVDANGDSDLFISSIETLASRGTDGLLLDPDLTIYPAVIEKCKEVGIKFQTCMGVARDPATGVLLGPSIGFMQYDYGKMMMKWLDEYRKVNWPEAKIEEIGVIGVTLSSSPPIHDRIRGGQDQWAEMYPEYKDNYFLADCITGALDSSTAYGLCGALMPTKPQFKYWLGVAAMDDLADGFASAAIDVGFADTSVTVCVGGTSLIIQWDAGEVTPWKGALMAGQSVFSEPMMASIYAQMAGWANMEDLWPEFIDHSQNDSYASLILTSNMLTVENYKRYLEWLDLYTGIDTYHYDVEGLSVDEFTVRRDPPASFAG
jgi:ABC-type sugar transport system substrate-binding protein